MRELTRAGKKGTKFTWEKEQNSFNEIKRIVTEDLRTNAFFDVDAVRTVVYTDASPTGLGAILAQVGKDGAERIVAHASKTLTETERKYSQTQREALGVVWAVEKFYFFLLGRHFTVRTRLLVRRQAERGHESADGRRRMGSALKFL